MTYSNNHPSMRYWNALAQQAAPQHSGTGWCPRCNTDCVLLDNDELHSSPFDFDRDSDGSE